MHFPISTNFNLGGLIHTAFTAGGNKEAEIATPTRDAVLSPRMAMATAAPEGSATSNPTHKDRS
jgi:hypothetical protein